MVQLKNPAALKNAAEKYGVKLSNTVNFDAEVPLLEVSAQFNGEDYIPSGAEADFGGLFGNVMRSIGLKKVHRKVSVDLASKSNTAEQRQAAANLGKANLKVDVKKSAAGAASMGLKAASFIPGLGKLESTAHKLDKITSFKIPKNAPPLRALASADKLIGSVSTNPAIKQQVINNTKALAALGNRSAQRGLLVLNTAQQIRAQVQVPVGTPAITNVKPLPTEVVKQETPKSTVLQMAQKSDAKMAKLGWWPRFKIWVLGHP